MIIRLHRHILYYTAVEYNSLFIQLPTVYDDIRLQFDYLLKSKAMISLFQRKILERFCYIKKCWRYKTWQRFWEHNYCNVMWSNRYFITYAGLPSFDLFQKFIKYFSSLFLTYGFKVVYKIFIQWQAMVRWFKTFEPFSFVYLMCYKTSCYACWLDIQHDLGFWWVIFKNVS